MRFGLAGLFNTVLGYCIIVACLFCGAGDFSANATAYAIGLLSSFTLNRRYVFISNTATCSSDVVRFLFAFAVAYCVNLGVLLVTRALVGTGNPLAQLPAMMSYSIVQFLLLQRFVFPDHR